VAVEGRSFFPYAAVSGTGIHSWRGPSQLLEDGPANVFHSSVRGLSGSLSTSRGGVDHALGFHHDVLPEHLRAPRFPFQSGGLPCFALEPDLAAGPAWARRPPKGAEAGRLALVLGGDASTCTALMTWLAGGGWSSPHANVLMPLADFPLGGLPGSWLLACLWTCGENRTLLLPGPACLGEDVARAGFCK